MTQRLFRLWVVAATALAAIGGPARGQTIVIDPRPIVPGPPPHPRAPRPRPPQRGIPLAVKKHTVDVSIVDGVALTSIDQLFYNPHPWTVEGVYIFPLADDVALSRFSMFVNGSEVEGRLLSVEEARRQYESIVARMRDPALLEYLGTRMFRARIAPIPPKSEVRVKLSYTQMLRVDNGLVRYRYPLGTDRSLPTPIETVSVLVNIESKAAIKSVFSPSHKLAVRRPSDHQASASYEGNGVLPDRNFELFYTLGNKEFGLSVLTYRERGRDGFFLARIAPPSTTTASQLLPKDVSFVIDTSGSMAGEKIQQAREALHFCLANLSAEDRFNIISFSHEATPLWDRLVPATPDNIKEAHAFADGLGATGGTNINDALLTALDCTMHQETDRPHLIVFLTDGQPTVGVTDPDEVLKNVAARNDGRVRLYVFGVGYDVNTRLLDLLAEKNRGTRDYVEPGEDLELKLSSFFRKVAEPVLADLALSFGDLNVFDLYPPRLSDLFAGSDLVVVGRYKGEGGKAVELAGTRRGRRERFVYETTFPAETRTHEFLPRLWATRKVGFLLDQIRLHGESKELKDTIVALATKYGIVTPYTAYLVTEPGRMALGGGIRGNVLAEALEEDEAYSFDTLRLGLGRGANADGRSAPVARSLERRETRRAKVRASITAGRLRAADAALPSRLAPIVLRKAAKEGVPVDLVRHVGRRTFYRIGERWVDAAFDKRSDTQKIELFSDKYFKLLRKYPGLARCFALGERVVVVADGRAYETVPSAG